MSNAGESSATCVPPLVSSSTVIELGPGKAGRVLCVADIRGDFKKLNEMVRETKAVAVIHTGDFGFLDGNSPSRMSPRVLRHTLQYTPLISEEARPSFLSHVHGPHLFSLLNPNPSSPSSFVLSQLGSLLNGDITFSVPVYAVYGPTEDVRVLEKFRTGEYEVKNLMVVDEAVTRLLDIGGVKLRLLGLGGSLQMAKMFDNGEGVGTIAGGSGMVWATALQIGELVDTAQRVFDPTETRILVTHSSVGREGLLAQLSLELKADFTISGSLHFRFISAFNEFSVQADADMFKQKLEKSKTAFMNIYESARPQLESVIQPDQREFLAKALQVAQKTPALDSSDEGVLWKNAWHWNLAEAGFGDLILVIREGRVSAETHSSGFNFSYRRYQQPKAAPPPSVVNIPAVNAPVQPAITQLPGQRPIPQGPAGFGRPPRGAALPPYARPPPVVASNAVTTQPAQGRSAFPQQSSNVPSTKVPEDSAAREPAGKRLNGAATNGYTKVEGKQLRERPGGPAKVDGPYKPAEPSQPAGGKKVKPPQAATPNVNGSETAGAAPQSGGEPVKAATPTPTDKAKDAEATKDGRDSSKTGKEREARGPREPREPRERKELREPREPRERKEPKEPREPREPRRARAGKTQDDKQKETNGVATDNSSAVDLAPTPSAEKAADNEKTSEKPSPSPTPRPPSFSLFCKGLPNPCSEEDLRDLWDADIRAKIVKVNIPSVRFDGGSRNKGFAYIDFSNEEDMQAALAKHGDTINGATISVVVSAPPPRDGTRPVRGRGGRVGAGGARGGRGGNRGSSDREQKDGIPATKAGGDKPGEEQ